MLPQALLRLSYHLEGDQVVPHYLAAHDERWLEALLAECARFAGQKRAAWLERLREPLPVRAPKAKLRIACHVLDGCCAERALAAVSPKEARATTFRLAAFGNDTRTAMLDAAAQGFGVSSLELEGSLFADLPSEQRVKPCAADFSAARLAKLVNWAITSALIRRAAQVRMRVWDDSQVRALIRQARVTGLLCRVSALDRPPRAEGAAEPLEPMENRALGFEFEVSGPFALFRHCEVYGRALAGLIPTLARSGAYELSAAVVLGRQSPSVSFELRSGVLDASGTNAPGHEHRVADRFERAFRRAARGWELTREPSPVECAGSLQFADFELTRRAARGPGWRLEIVGFWTPRYLAQKLERLQQGGIERFVLCVDQGRQCTEGELPSDPRLIGFERRIDPRAVLALLERGL